MQIPLPNDIVTILLNFLDDVALPRETHVNCKTEEFIALVKLREVLLDQSDSNRDIVSSRKSILSAWASHSTERLSTPPIQYSNILKQFNFFF